MKNIFEGENFAGRQNEVPSEETESTSRSVSNEEKYRPKGLRRHIKKIAAGMAAAGIFSAAEAVYNNAFAEEPTSPSETNKIFDINKLKKEILNDQAYYRESEISKDDEATKDFIENTKRLHLFRAEKLSPAIEKLAIIYNYGELNKKRVISQKLAGDRKGMIDDFTKNEYFLKMGIESFLNYNKKNINQKTINDIEAYLKKLCEWLREDMKIILKMQNKSEFSSISTIEHLIEQINKDLEKLNKKGGE